MPSGCNEAVKQTVCTICEVPFCYESEGGALGYIGILPVAFCLTCKAGIYDFAEQHFEMGEQKLVSDNLVDNT